MQTREEKCPPPLMGTTGRQEFGKSNTIGNYGHWILQAGCSYTRRFRDARDMENGSRCEIPTLIHVPRKTFFPAAVSHGRRFQHASGRDDPRHTGSSCDTGTAMIRRKPDPVIMNYIGEKFLRPLFGLPDVHSSVHALLAKCCY